MYNFLIILFPKSLDGSMEVSSNTTSLQFNIDGESLAVKDLRSRLNDSQTEIKGEFYYINLLLLFIVKPFSP